jgi:predicted DNA-binding helix-hairpin-helix protein
MSVNLELPTAESLKALAPNKSRKSILTPMRQVQLRREENKNELILYRGAPKFVPAGQSTQMIIGATKESDLEIVSVAESLYQKFDLKRVFYSAFINVNQDKNLPATLDGPPLLREHRLYQADWLLRFYEFEAKELLDEKRPNFNIYFDPKCDWALRHPEQFPVEINRADYYTLLRVPGIGVRSARRIVQARRTARFAPAAAAPSAWLAAFRAEAHVDALHRRVAALHVQLIFQVDAAMIFRYLALHLHGIQRQCQIAVGGMISALKAAILDKHHGGAEVP